MTAPDPTVRATYLDDERGGLTVLVDPFVCVFGGIVGGAVVTTSLWAAVWRVAARRARAVNLTVLTVPPRGGSDA